MEAALSLAESLGVRGTETPPQGDEWFTTKPHHLPSWKTTRTLQRLRAAQTGLLQLEEQRRETEERVVVGAVADPDALRANLERIHAWEAVLGCVGEASGAAELIAQLRQPFIGDFVVMHATSQRDAISLVHGAANVMADLPSVLQALCSMSDLPPASTADAPPLDVLQKVAFYLARCQHYHEALSVTRTKVPLQFLLHPGSSLS